MCIYDVGYCRKKINASKYVSYCNGLAGIGWGYQYLEENDFIEIEENKVLLNI